MALVQTRQIETGDSGWAATETLIMVYSGKLMAEMTNRPRHAAYVHICVHGTKNKEIKEKII